MEVIKKITEVEDKVNIHINEVPEKKKAERINTGKIFKYI